MTLHKDLPASPYAILDPALRWFPADENLRESTFEKLTPPLVAQLRKKVQEFRDSGHVGAVDLPVYMCDSILTPTERADIFGKSYRLSTVVGHFDIPGETVDAAEAELSQQAHQLVAGDEAGLASVDKNTRRTKRQPSYGASQTKSCRRFGARWPSWDNPFQPLTLTIERSKPCDSKNEPSTRRKTPSCCTTSPPPTASAC